MDTIANDIDITGREVMKADGTRGVVVDGSPRKRNASVDVMWIGGRWIVTADRADIRLV